MQYLQFKLHNLFYVVFYAFAYTTSATTNKSSYAQAKYMQLKLKYK